MSDIGLSFGFRLTSIKSLLSNLKFFTPQNMEVYMGYFLAPVFAVVDHNTKPRFVYAELSGDLPGGHEQGSGEAGVNILQFNMPFGNYERMYGSFGVDIMNCNP